MGGVGAVCTTKADYHSLPTITTTRTNHNNCFAFSCRVVVVAAFIDVVVAVLLVAIVVACHV